MASVVRPGAPAGPHTATTRPRAGSGAAGAGVGSGSGSVVAEDHRGQCLHVGVGHRGAHPDAGGAHGRLLAGARDDGDRAHAVGPQVVDRREVEARRLQRHHGGVGLAGGRAGQQVVDVDAALEHDEVAATAQDAQGLGLPARAGGEQEDHLHPRLTTVRLGASYRARRAKKAGASASATASTSWRLPLVPNDDASSGASTTVAPLRAGPSGSGSLP